MRFHCKFYLPLLHVRYGIYTWYSKCDVDCDEKNFSLATRKLYSPTKSLVPPTILVRVRLGVRVRGSGLGFWNLVGGTRDWKDGGR